MPVAIASSSKVSSLLFRYRASLGHVITRDLSHLGYNPQHQHPFPSEGGLLNCKPPAGRRSVRTFLLVDEKKVRTVSLATNKSMSPSLLISAATTPRLSAISGYSRCLAYIRECAISVVVKQPARRRLKKMWNAVSTLCIFTRTAFLALCLGELDELADEQPLPSLS